MFEILIIAGLGIGGYGAYRAYKYNKEEKEREALKKAEFEKTLAELNKRNSDPWKRSYVPPVYPKKAATPTPTPVAETKRDTSSGAGDMIVGAVIGAAVNSWLSSDSGSSSSSSSSSYDSGSSYSSGGGDSGGGGSSSDF